MVNAKQFVFSGKKVICSSLVGKKQIYKACKLLLGNLNSFTEAQVSERVGNIKIHSGILALWVKITRNSIGWFENLILRPPETITMCGFSLGSSLSNVATFMTTLCYKLSGVPVPRIYNVAWNGFRTGNLAYAKWFERNGNLFHVANVKDPVGTFPSTKMKYTNLPCIDTSFHDITSKMRKLNIVKGSTCNLNFIRKWIRASKHQHTIEIPHLPDADADADADTDADADAEDQETK
jgi:hypothetical protein